VVPAKPFASKAYVRLREFLAEQIEAKPERVSIVGQLAGRARRMSGQMLRVVVTELRGMYSCTTEKLVTTIARLGPKD
jgi:hypothetical protein